MQPPCNDGHRIASTGVKALMGAGAGTAGLLVGGIIGVSIEKGFFKSYGWFSGLTGLIIGAPIGYLFLEPAGVCFGGNVFDETGSYWGTFVGNAVGCALGIGLIALTKTTFPGTGANESFSGTAIMITFPISGSILGYNYLLKPRRQ